jgi:hypothetical protein
VILKLARKRGLKRAREAEIASALAAARDLEAEGRAVDAIDLLTGANRAHRDAEIERRLVGLRHEAFATLNGGGMAEQPTPGSLPETDGVPRVEPADLTPDLLRAAILRNGCLHVRGLVPESRASELVGLIDQAFEGSDANAAGAPESRTTPWYEPFTPRPEYSLGSGRSWVRNQGGVWAADSPRVMFELLDTFEQVGLKSLITAYLGERPAFSANKSTLRRVSPSERGGDWHQDGAFLGQGIRALNIWLSLSHCGLDAPGLDVVPRRLEGIVGAGTSGGNFSWSAGTDAVEQISKEAAVVRPTFEPGDALLFDELFMHRTASDSEMTRDRYATESWFFAPSAYPERQVPLVY